MTAYGYMTDEELAEYDLEFMYDHNRKTNLPLTECITRDLLEEPEFEPLGRSSQLVLPGIERPYRRPLLRPNPAMRIVHKRVCILMTAGLRAFHKPRPVRVGAYTHGKGRYLYHVDLREAFGAVDGLELARILFESDRSQSPYNVWGSSIEDVHTMLQRYCLHPGGGLVQGGPASSHLFEAYVGQLLDRHFHRTNGHSIPRLIGMPAEPSWSYRHQLAYSRFTDDLVFSSPIPIGRHKRAYINGIIREAGFSVNTQKTRVYDLTRKPVVINGVGIRLTPKGLRTYLPRPQLRKIEGLVHRAATQGGVDPSQVQGAMGWFFSITQRDRMNRTEQRVTRAYARYRAAYTTP